MTVAVATRFFGGAVGALFVAIVDVVVEVEVDTVPVDVAVTAGEWIELVVASRFAEPDEPHPATANTAVAIRACLISIECRMSILLFYCRIYLALLCQVVNGESGVSQDGFEKPFANVPVAVFGNARGSAVWVFQANVAARLTDLPKAMYLKNLNELPG